MGKHGRLLIEKDIGRIFRMCDVHLTSTEILRLEFLSLTIKL